MGNVAIDLGDCVRATALFSECIIKHKEAKWAVTGGLEGLAAVAALQGDRVRAAGYGGC